MPTGQAAANWPNSTIVKSIWSRLPATEKGKWKMAYVCRLPCFEHLNRSTSIPSTFIPIHTEHAAALYAFFKDRPCQWVPPDLQLRAFPWVVMPFSLCNAPLTFHGVINDVLRDHLGIFLWVYIYDILIFSKKTEEHKRHLDLVHELLQRHQLFSCTDNSTFFQPRVPFCRYVIDKDGLDMDPEKIRVILGGPPPTTVHEVRQFIGLRGFYKQFVEGFQAVAAPLTAMSKAALEWV